MKEKTKFKNLSSRDKILKVAKICEVVSKVLYIVAFVGVVVLAVSAIVLPLTVKEIGDFKAGEIAIIFGVCALYCFMAINVFWNVEQIFKSIRVNQTPFHERVTHYLKKSAVAVILISIIPALIGSILIRAITPESAARFNFQYMSLAIGVVMLILGYIFNYGIELQKKDDETL